MRFSYTSWFVCSLASCIGCSDGQGEPANGSTDAASTAGPTTTGASGVSAASQVTTAASASSSMGIGTTSSTFGGTVGPGGSGTDGSGGGSGTGGTSSTTGQGSGTGGVDGTGGVNGTSGGGNPAACEPEVGTNPNRVCIKGKAYYLNGINVAWDQWTADLTNFDAGNFETMFATLEASGGNSIRWWWFIDGENQLAFSGNLVQPLSQDIFDNLDLAFDAAAAHGILIMPVLLSFDIENQGREFLVTNESATDAFVANVVTPLVQRYDDHAGLGLWEIMNEGDWLLSDEGGAVSIADYQRFHAKVAAGIHAAAADALVTTGSASFKYLEADNNILSDQALRAAAGGDPLAHLDVYQTHYYSWMHGDGWSYEPWIRTSTEWQGDGKPILIGEFPCIGEQGRWSTMQMHVESVNQGYAGTFCWAYFDNRADSTGTWADAAPAVRAIAEQIPAAITGE